MTAYLKAIPTFEVQVATRWTLEGDNPHSGDSTRKLIVQHPRSFRLTVDAESDREPSLVCASDGRTVTRLYQKGDLVIYSKNEGGLEQLLEDALTDSSLKGTGLDIVVRPDAHQYLMSSISDVKDLGIEDLDGRQTHRFSTAWFGGSQVDFWVATDREPVLLRWKRTQKLKIGEIERQFAIDNQLTWKLDASFSADQGEIEMPSGAIEVVDLQSYLLKGSTDQLLGRPVPKLSLKLVDGSSLDLAQHRGKHVVMLFFFATWAAPSTEDMPELLARVKEHEGRGVVFYAVNVGESAEKVRAFLKSRDFTNPVVLDSERRAARAFRITSLPVTVLLGKDGTVQAAHVGLSPEERSLIRQDLLDLIQGKTLVAEDR
jgi:peroxiredoxin